MLSMTGFGRGNYENEKWAVDIFVKSLNGKSLEVYVKSNYNLTSLEFSIRRLVREFVKRGTVNVQLSVKRKDIFEPVNLEQLFTNLKFFKIIKDKLELQISDDTLIQLATRFSEAPQEEIDPPLEEAISCALTDALKELLNRRFQEGEYIRRDMEERMRRIEDLLGEILKNKEEVYERVKRKIFEKVEELGLSEDKAFILNEIALVISKMDVEEEITRLKAHITKSKELMKSNEDVGKRLEFILQEMHREITTLANKLPDLSPMAVEIKTEIDRLRQQVANVE
ncbi:MAG: YicC family protein [Aquificaceae bacterium]